jgi:hypothetical protein
MSRSETFLRNRLTDAALVRIIHRALLLGFPRFALGFYGRGSFPNVRLWDPKSGDTLDLEGKALNPVNREWEEKHLTHYLSAV